MQTSEQTTDDVCKWSLHRGHCLDMVTSIALEIAGSWYGLYDAADVDRLVYQLFFLSVSL